MVSGRDIMVSCRNHTLSLLKHIYRHWGGVVKFRLVLIEGVKHTHNFAGIMTVLKPVASYRRRSHAHISRMKDPISAERNISSVQPHGAGNVEIAVVNPITKLREAFHHQSNSIAVTVHRIVKILHPILAAQFRVSLRSVVLAQVYNHLQPRCHQCLPRILPST